MGVGHETIHIAQSVVDPIHSETGVHCVVVRMTIEQNAALQALMRIVIVIDKVGGATDLVDKDCLCLNWRELRTHELDVEQRERR